MPHLEQLTKYVSSTRLQMFFFFKIYASVAGRQLEDLRNALLATYNNSTTIINSTTIADELRECEESIDDFLSSYSVSRNFLMVFASRLMALNLFFSFLQQWTSKMLSTLYCPNRLLTQVCCRISLKHSIESNQSARPLKPPFLLSILAENRQTSLCSFVSRSRWAISSSFCSYSDVHVALTGLWAICSFLFQNQDRFSDSRAQICGRGPLSPLLAILLQVKIKHGRACWIPACQ